MSETCRVSFQNKFEKLVSLVGFIIRNLSRCTATPTSKAINYPELIVGFITTYLNQLTIPMHMPYRQTASHQTFLITKS